MILEPSAVAELIHPIIGTPTSRWSAEAADRGSTVFSNEPLGTNKIGVQMMDQRLRMVSDPWDPERPASPIELGSWIPLVPVTWFEEGVLRNLAYGASYAREQGTERVYNPGGLRLTANGPEQTLEEMIASTQRGIWVNRLSHVAVMNGRSLLLTGMTRDGTFLIHNGRVTSRSRTFISPSRRSSPSTSWRHGASRCAPRGRWSRRQRRFPRGPGSTRAGRYLRIIYVPDPEPESVFVITAYDLGAKAKQALRRRRRRKKQ